MWLLRVGCSFEDVGLLDCFLDQTLELESTISSKGHELGVELGVDLHGLERDRPARFNCHG